MKSHKRGLPIKYVKTHLQRSNYRCKTASIIVPPPHSQHKLWIKSGKPHLFILISYVRQYSIGNNKNQYLRTKFRGNFFEEIYCNL